MSRLGTVHRYTDLGFFGCSSCSTVVQVLQVLLLLLYSCFHFSLQTGTKLARPNYTKSRDE